MSDVRGLHYEISRPVRNPSDGYYYQRVRQVDENGNLVGVGEQTFRSANPNSIDGLFDRRLNVPNLGLLLKDFGMAGLGYGLRRPTMMSQGTAGVVRDLMNGITEEFKSWQGTDRPWEPVLDWRKGGSSGVSFVPPNAPGGIGDGRGVGNWWENTGPTPQRRPSLDPWENLSAPRDPIPPSPITHHNFEGVRDSVAAAHIPAGTTSLNTGFQNHYPLLSRRRSNQGLGTATVLEIGGKLLSEMMRHR